MAPTCKLYYFNVKALAEPIRFALSHAGVEFEDIRITKEEWATLKPKMDWGVMPVLEEDGKKLSQSLTILRYLGRKYGLAGNDAFETAKCDEYVDAMNDLRIESTKVFKEEDPGKKAEMHKNLMENVIPAKWGKFCEILKKNGTGYLVGKSITYADLYVAHFSDMMATNLFPDKVNDYPEMVALQAKVFGAPGIKEWIEKRPVTQF